MFLMCDHYTLICASMSQKDLLTGIITSSCLLLWIWHTLCKSIVAESGISDNWNVPLFMENPKSAGSVKGGFFKHSKFCQESLRAQAQLSLSSYPLIFAQLRFQCIEIALMAKRKWDMGITRKFSSADFSMKGLRMCSHLLCPVNTSNSHHGFPICQHLWLQQPHLAVVRGSIFSYLHYKVDNRHIIWVRHKASLIEILTEQVVYEHLKY